MSREGRMYRGLRLQVWGQNLRMFSQVQLEGVTLPSAHCLDNLEGHTAQHVFQGSTDAETVSLELGLFRCFRQSCHMSGEHASCQRLPDILVSASRVWASFVCEKWPIHGRIVGGEVVEQGAYRINVACLFREADVFACETGFGSRDSDDPDLVSFSVNVFPYQGPRDMLLWIEGGLILYYKLAEPRNGEETDCEHSPHSYVDWVLLV
ncbi:uncharacterized protein B0H18DRAFT_1007087 [Fomitopsis serialis]|uniref:uncharacterized protein n=1 Tax=Fomitopsis serialis TaxID=139415 RepID=UPI00200786E9|nr:uncharacterized protein B0H18DRAFT_1007087 [Neoantrodia serialis]KAH9926233.1 hypothetical protein B0H18DRAFT_1007087 [Neoantrodia serialis]